jgi:glycosyltransferase involved in cell wall biosynthesis
MQVGVVIPLFKQAQYLIECVTSVLAQTLVPTGIVVVNDGCPNSSSDTLPRAIAAAWPERVLYRRQENRGPSGARNTGIRALLDRWPEIESILPLDADDWLEEHCLEVMAARLASDGSDWVYPDLQFFGIAFKNFLPWSQLNPFRLFFENQCAAPSLIKRRVFDAGVFYDETMHEGYEDWEFFLRALSRGFCGTYAGNVGVNYRLKKNSRVVDAREKHKQMLCQIHQRHHVVSGILTACEHSYMPRFRFICEQGQCYDFSDPMLPPVQECPSDPAYVPPITVIGSKAAFELLKRNGMLRGILFSVQRQVRTHPLRVDLETRKTGLGFEQKRDLREDVPALIAIQSACVADGSISADNIRPRISSAHSLAISSPEHGRLQTTSGALDFEILLRYANVWAGSETEAVPSPFEDRQPSTTRFARAHLFESGETTYPLSRDEKIDICFAVPSIKLGGIDHCVLKLAEAVKQLVKSARLHLLVTDFAEIEFDRAQLLVFDEIVSVAHAQDNERLQMVTSILDAMDIIINAHSLRAYQALTLLPRKSIHRPVCISYLHAAGTAGNDAPYGGLPYQYEGEIDCFLVISEELRDFLINSGVNEERIRIGPNAPVVRLPTRQQALLLADQKAERQRCGGGSFELLFAGPLDAAKGLSGLDAFMRLADHERINLRLTLVGATDLNGAKINWPANRVRFVRATGDRNIRARHFENADGFALLSQCEGVPVALLDAMAHGCIVFAADLGSIGELIVDGVNGFLCPAEKDDDLIARAALERVKVAMSDPSGCREVRRCASETAMGFAWDQVAATVEDLLIQATRTRSLAN